MPDGSPSMAREDLWSGDLADDPLAAGLIFDAPEEQGTEEAPATEVEPALDQIVETPTEEPSEEAPVEQTATAETETPTEQYTFGGRTFATQEAAEESYRQAQRELVERGTRANQAEARIAALQAEIAQQRADIQRVLPLIQQAQQPTQSPRLDPSLLERAGLDPELAPVLQQFVDGQVASRLGPVEQELQRERERVASEAQQAAQASEAEALRSAQTTFRAAHPDYTEHEQAMISVMADLELVQVDAQGRPVPLRGSSGQIALSDPTWYEIAYEAARRPALGRVLRANPALSETDDGMAIARLNAAQLEAQEARAAQPQTQAPATSPAAGVHVLTGPTNTPSATAQATKDAIDEIVELDRSERRRPWTGAGF